MPNQAPLSSPSAGTHFYITVSNHCGVCGGRLKHGCSPGNCEDPEIGCVCGEVHYGECFDGDLICEACNASTNTSDHQDPDQKEPTEFCNHGCHIWSTRGPEGAR